MWLLGFHKVQTISFSKVLLFKYQPFKHNHVFLVDDGWACSICHNVTWNQIWHVVEPVQGATRLWTVHVTYTTLILTYILNGSQANHAHAVSILLTGKKNSVHNVFNLRYKVQTLHTITTLSHNKNVIKGLDTHKICMYYWQDKISVSVTFKAKETGCTSVPSVPDMSKSTHIK